MTEKNDTPKNPQNYADPVKTERMQVIRKDRREAGFTEVTVWLPEEYARMARDWAWKLIDRAGRHFPHRRPEGSERKQGK
ncbi:MAG: hypothetical protein AAGD43_02230 [Pseudomonadota bacterium]